MQNMLDPNREGEKLFWAKNTALLVVLSVNKLQGAEQQRVNVLQEGWWKLQK